jgi:hypothetical protein
MEFLEEPLAELLDAEDLDCRRDSPPVDDMLRYTVFRVSSVDGRCVDHGQMSGRKVPVKVVLRK